MNCHRSNFKRYVTPAVNADSYHLGSNLNNEKPVFNRSLMMGFWNVVPFYNGINQNAKLTYNKN